MKRSASPADEQFGDATTDTCRRCRRRMALINESKA